VSLFITGRIYPSSSRNSSSGEHSWHSHRSRSSKLLGRLVFPLMSMSIHTYTVGDAFRANKVAFLLLQGHFFHQEPFFRPAACKLAASFDERCQISLDVPHHLNDDNILILHLVVQDVHSLEQLGAVRYQGFPEVLDLIVHRSKKIAKTKKALQISHVQEVSEQNHRTFSRNIFLAFPPYTQR
jgi:hypothetical protein